MRKERLRAREMSVKGRANVALVAKILRRMTGEKVKTVHEGNFGMGVFRYTGSEWVVA